MARDPVYRTVGVNRTADVGPSGPGLRGSPQEYRRAILDALSDGDGPMSVEALGREVTEGLHPEDAEEDETAQCVLLAHVLPPLLAEERVAFSPERRTVSLTGAGTSERRTLLSGGIVSVTLIAAVVASPDPTSPAFLGAVGLSLLPFLYLARGRISRLWDRVPGLAPRSDGPGSVDSTGASTATGAADAPPGPKQRILALLLADGGRVRQQTLIDRLDLSKSTVSRYVTSLAEAGYVTKVAVGRENLVCLPSARPVADSDLDAGTTEDRPDAGN